MPQNTSFSKISAPLGRNYLSLTSPPGAGPHNISAQDTGLKIANFNRRSQKNLKDSTVVVGVEQMFLYATPSLVDFII